MMRYRQPLTLQLVAAVPLLSSSSASIRASPSRTPFSSRIRCFIRSVFRHSAWAPSRGLSSWAGAPS